MDAAKSHESHPSHASDRPQGGDLFAENLDDRLYVDPESGECSVLIASIDDQGQPVLVEAKTTDYLIPGVFSDQVTANERSRPTA